MHPVISRLAQCAEELTTQDVAWVLGLDRTHVARLVKQGRLEARAHTASTGHNLRYLVARDALILYLLRSTTGSQDVLRDAIRETFPKFPLKPGTQALPDNVIPMPAAPAAPRGARIQISPAPRPGQLIQTDLFDPHAHLPTAAALLPTPRTKA